MKLTRFYIKTLLGAALLLSAQHGALAQQKPSSEKDVNMHQAAGNYYCYPWLNETPPTLTPAPKGYRPFHIEHYGRHGSRWLIGDSKYKRAKRILENARSNGKLTPLGIEVADAISKIEKDSRKRDGELSDNGALQHEGIGKRMVKNFHDVFTPRTHVDAKSTVVIRCILSMQNGLKGIQQEVPGILITTDASEADMRYMNRSNEAAAKAQKKAQETVYKDFSKAHANNGDYLSRLFNDPVYAKDSVGSKLFSSLFSVLANTQSHSDQPWLLEKVFTPEEIRQRWLIRNASWFIQSGNSSMTNGLMPRKQIHLLRNIIESADTAITSNNLSVNLRYGHDTIVFPLAVLLDINGLGEEINDLELLAEKGWHDYLVVPMAGNIQIIFYRPDGSLSADDVLIKVLLNEQEATLPLQPIEGPYYKWTDFRNHYLSKIGDQ